MGKHHGGAVSTRHAAPPDPSLDEADSAASPLAAPAAVRTTTVSQPAPATRPRRRLDPRHWLALALSLLCLLPLGAHQIILAQRSSASAQAVTGDPLLDAVLQHTADFLATANSTQRSMAMYQDVSQDGVSAYLDKTLTAAQWQDDPRWWELSYQLRANLARAAAYNSIVYGSPAETSPDGQTELDAAEAESLALLKQYQREGRASPSLLFELLSSLEGEWHREAMQTKSVVADTKETRSQFWRENRAITRQQHGAEEQELLAEIRRLDPDNAFSYYWEAGFEATEGRHVETLRLLAAGNALPRCTAYSLFPRADLQHAAAQGTALHSIPVSSALNAVSDHQRSTRGRRGTRALADTFKHFAQASDERALTEIQRALARLGSSAAEANTARIAHTVINSCLKEALTDAQVGRLAIPVPALRAAEQTTLAIRTAMTTSTSNSSYAAALTPTQSISESVKWWVVPLLDNGESLTLQTSEEWWNTQVNEQQLLIIQLRPEWDKLAQFDYAAELNGEPEIP